MVITGGFLENIRSNKILKYLLSFLEKIKKLQIISCNKKLQERNRINFLDYINAKGIYKILEKSGKGQEYKIPSYNLIFEGEYKKGKRNGKGKEYYNNNKLKFEGEYIDGKKITGKEYDTEGNIILILENNKGKEYYSNGI